jgi:acetyl-CoA carboxylase carboxyl transferase subunit beta
MSWFKREKRSIENPTPVDERRVRTEGLWTKCNSCNAIIWKKDIEANWEVCPKCDHHFRLSAHRRLELLLDDAAWTEHDADLASSDPLHFADTKQYSARLKAAQHKLNMKDAIITAEGKLNGRPVICCAMEFAFIGGSMGAVVGEKVARAIEMSLAQKIPLIVVSCSGGARMMEGTVSLMQLAKVSAALARLDDARVPYISVLTDPTTGGVTASFAMLGDLNIAEPAALIGFAGPRVIEQTIRQKLPQGFQTAEFLLEHGFLDAVVPRKEMKAYIGRSLDFFLQPS